VLADHHFGSPAYGTPYGSGPPPLLWIVRIRALDLLVDASISNMAINVRDHSKGDWIPQRDEPSNQVATLDDVVHAYRWILGREPESAAKIESHLKASAENRQALRRRFLASPEFARQANVLDLRHDLDTAQAEGLDEGIERIIFIHVPKTGGTTIHFHLATQLAAGLTCTFRHNSLLTAPAISLSMFRLFSGHYDSRCLRVIPGLRRKVLTVLRKPRDRLVSVYRYLAAHKPERTLIEGFELAKAARTLPFDRFLEAALEINPAAIDNTYLRAFGSCLPAQRWERAAELPWMARFGNPSERERSDMLERAVQFVERLDGVAIMEDMDRTASALFRTCGLLVPIELEHLKAIDRIDASTEGFEPPPVVADTDRSIVERFTQWDEVIYQAALSRTLRLAGD
jgi:hypothetical protein